MGSNKQLNTPQIKTVSGTPSVPETGFVKEYVKDDGKGYRLLSDGTEIQIDESKFDISGAVDTYADLPSTANIDDLMYVRDTSGVIGLRKKKGVYIYKATGWDYANDLTVDDELFVKHDEVSSDLLGVSTTNPLSEKAGNDLSEMIDIRSVTDNAFGGGVITWKNDVIHFTKRIIAIPLTVGSTHININVHGKVDGYFVGSWQVLYVDLDIEALRADTGNYDVQEDELKVSPYSTLSGDVLQSGWIRIIIGYNHNDSGHFVFSNGNSVPDGYIGELNSQPNQYQYIYSATNTFTATTKEIFTTDVYTIQAGMNVEYLLKMPLRNDSTSWGGAYVNVDVNINGTWYNMGNGGYDGGIMAYDAKMIATHTETKLLDIVNNLDIKTSYTVQFRVRCKAYTNYTTYVNASHDLNRTEDGLDGGNALYTPFSNQNYTNFIVKEVKARI